jgi:hypothetical protein
MKKRFSARPDFVLTTEYTRTFNSNKVKLSFEWVASHLTKEGKIEEWKAGEQAFINPHASIKMDETVPLLSVTVRDEMYHTYYEKITVGIADTSRFGQILPKLGSRCNWFVDAETGRVITET